MNNVREPAVAGMFYYGEKTQLQDNIKMLFEEAGKAESFNNIYGIVAPHAGYVYSGLPAALAYKTLAKKDFETAVILSPSHREYFPGICVYSGDVYKTPLGQVEVNNEKRKLLTSHSDVIFEGTNGHGSEHAVEVHLPFLQMINDDFSIVPMVIGDQRKSFIDILADALTLVYDDRIVIIASSDLSHFHSAKEADKLDGRIEAEIEKFNFDGLQNSIEDNLCEACGAGGIYALMKSASKLGFKNSKVLMRTDSGRVSGNTDEVVGYLSAVIYG